MNEIQRFRIDRFVVRFVEPEVGSDDACAEKKAERLAPNDPALAVGVFGMGLAVAIAPDLIRQLLHCFIALRVILQSDGLLRLRPHDRRAVVNELADLLEHSQRHRRRRRVGDRLLHAAADHVANLPRC